MIPDPDSIPHSPYLPRDPQVVLYNTAFGHLTPYEFTGWKSEEASWKTGCYLHAGLNPPMPYKLTGPGALQLLRDACVNDFTRFSIGASKHAVMCNSRGNVMADGMVLRTGEQEFICYYLGPYLDYLVAISGHEVQGADLTDQVFLFQVGGPTSLQTLEAATGESLRDIEFIWHRPSTIRTHPDTEPTAVRIFRLGVAGTLAYEVHGDAADAPAVYEALMAAGEPFGIQRLGLRAYGMNHTENGFLQTFIHFLPAWTQDPQFVAHLHSTGQGQALQALQDLPGSAGPDPARRFHTPMELGWGHMITFDHDFTGRAALQTQPGTRRPVTLVWEPEDIVDVYASQFRPQHEHQFMDFPANPIWTVNNSAVFTDEVTVDGHSVGTSSGRIFSHSYNAMLSLAILDPACTEIGQEVLILWGEPGTRQKQIRARVERFPYLDLPRNRDIDVRALP